MAVNLFWPLCCAIVMALGPSRAFAHAQQSPEASRTLSEKEVAACGPRAVYLLLQDLGIAADYDAIRMRTPLTADGTTFASLRDTLESYGVKASIRRLDPSDLIHIRHPTIVHLASTYTESRAGHFMYVRSITPDSVYGIDPISLRHIPDWKWGSFSDAWTGGCLVVERSRPLWKDPVAVGAALNLTLAIGLTWWSLRNRCSRALSTIKSGGAVVRCVAPAGVVLVVLSHPVLADDTGLRSFARGGVNAAALLLESTNLDAGELLTEQERYLSSSTPIDQVQAFLLTRGYKSDLRRITPSELKECIPAIVLLRHERGKTGTYYLIIAMSSKEVTLVRTDIVQVEVIPIDDFRYRWTGHSLVIAERDTGATRSLVLAASLSLGFTAGVGRRRLSYKRGGA